MNTCEQLAEAIERLGATPDLMARTLRRLGVRGLPGNARKCALANYLRKLGYRDPLVRLDSIQATRHQHTVVMPTLRALGQFLVAFDNLRYPELKEDPHVPAATGP
jgi:hypothetical protein